VLQRLSEHIAKAFDRAAAAEQRAAGVTDPELRLGNERLAQSWRFVARSLQFVESLEHFLTDSQRQRNAFAGLEEFARRRNLLPPEMVRRNYDEDSEP
jgi:aminopeptidase N